MNWLIFEDTQQVNFWPLTYTRPIYALRCGIDTLVEKWAQTLGSVPNGMLTSPELKEVWGKLPDGNGPILWINGRFFPNDEIHAHLNNLRPEHRLIDSEGLTLAFITEKLLPECKVWSEEEFAAFEVSGVVSTVKCLKQLPDLFSLNGEMIRADFERITKNRYSAPIEDKHTIVYGSNRVFIEPGAKIRAAILNAEDGPIYIGEGVQIQEGAMVHGAHAFLPNAVVNMGAKLRGDSTLGPYCKVGGEFSNSILQGYSNKGHDGFVGNSYIGEWCNIGADTNTSNLKNNYAPVRLWNEAQGKFVDTGLQFCGLIMGDHSKCGINTMFNTGTVVGVGANIFGDGFPRNVIPSFSWGGAAGLTTHALPKVFETAQRVMERRKEVLSPAQHQLLEDIFKKTSYLRTWEKSSIKID